METPPTTKKQHYREKLEGSFIVNLKDGRWIKTTDRRLPNGGFISVQTDITELKNLSNDLRLQNLELETLNGLLEQAVSTDSLTGAKSRSAIIKAVNDLFNSDRDIIVKCSYNKYFEKWEPIEQTDKRIHHVNDLKIIEE